MAVLIIFTEQCFGFYNAKRYFLSTALLVVGTFLAVWGCAVFIKASYPSQIVSSCFYSNNSIEPPPGSWWCRIHFGTRALRGGHLQLLGAITYALGCAIWIQEDYQYQGEEDSGVWEYIDLVFGNFLLVAGCIYQLFGQYPQSVLNRGQSRSVMTQVQNTWQMTDLQLSGWCFEILSLIWLLRSAIKFDNSTESSAPVKEGEEPPSVPWREYDWVAFGDCWLALVIAIGSYFALAQAYREGTRLDAVLIQQAKRAAIPDLEESLVEAYEPPGRLSEAPVATALESGPSAPLNRKQSVVVGAPAPASPRTVVANPLKGIRDLTDARTVLRRARKIANDVSDWKQITGNGGPKDITVWLHKDAHAVRFETNRFVAVDPLLLAAVIQSEAFKVFQLRGAGGNSVSIVGKLAGAYSEGAVVFYEKISPNPPMPAHESTFASLLHESRRLMTNEAPAASIAEVVEWSINEGSVVTGNGAVSNTTSQKVVKVNPFRYWSTSSEGILRGMVWLEDIAKWMPEFLLKAEMAKVPVIVDELTGFFGRSKETIDSTITKSLNTWIWQKVHNSVSPLAAAVLVRTSPAYRVLLSKYPGLRTKIPEPVSIPVGPLVHPLEHFPITLDSDADIDVPIAVKQGSDFISNEFGSWHPSESDSRAKPGRAKITVWRQEVEGERIKPFRIQARISGIDPLTLALLIHRNKLNELVEVYNGLGGANLRPDPSAMFRQSIDPLRSRQSVSSSPERVAGPDMSVLGSMIGDDHVTVANNLIATFQNGSVRVYRERKRRTRYMPGSREREFTFASVMKDVSPLKAVVVHFGVKSVLGKADPLATTDDSGVVKLRRFHAWSLENDGGTDTKLTWCGLVPVGGRTEKLSAWLSSGSELKEKTKFVEKLASMFVNDPRAREAVTECHQFIAYNTLRSAMGRELQKLSISYLAATSSDYKTLINDIQPPPVGGLVGFDQDLPHLVEMKKRKMAEANRKRADVSDEDDQQSDSSQITVPLSPVESHRKLQVADD
jgi:hypothetical protein